LKSWKSNYEELSYEFPEKEENAMSKYYMVRISDNFEPASENCHKTCPFAITKKINTADGTKTERICYFLRNTWQTKEEACPLETIDAAKTHAYKVGYNAGYHIGCTKAKEDFDARLAQKDKECDDYKKECDRAIEKTVDDMLKMQESIFTWAQNSYDKTINPITKHAVKKIASKMIELLDELKDRINTR
jgi:flagellar biosynthesis/type III secretory pathway protein FliH